MTTRSLLENNLLADALDAQTAEVKARPGDLAARTLLFEILAYAALWERATRQIDAIGHLLADNPQAQVGVAVYRRLVEAEVRRARLFAEGLPPHFALEPPSEVQHHLRALDALRQGKPEEARTHLDQATAERTPRPGTLQGVAFDDVRDADDLLAPVLEVFAPAGYAWVPLEQIQFLEVPAPQTFRDLLWAPAKIATFDGQMGEVHLPALYPGSHLHPDSATHLGRATDWVDLGGGITRGAGLKTFLVGDEAKTLFELSDLRFTPPRSTAPPEAPTPP